MVALCLNQATRRRLLRRARKTRDANERVRCLILLRVRQGLTRLHGDLHVFAHPLRHGGPCVIELQYVAPFCQALEANRAVLIRHHRLLSTTFRMRSLGYGHDPHTGHGPA